MRRSGGLRREGWQAGGFALSTDIVVFSQILRLGEENLLLEPSSTVNFPGFAIIKDHEAIFRKVERDHLNARALPEP